MEINISTRSHWVVPLTNINLYISSQHQHQQKQKSKIKTVKIKITFSFFLIFHLIQYSDRSWYDYTRIYRTEDRYKICGKIGREEHSVKEREMERYSLNEPGKCEEKFLFFPFYLYKFTNTRMNINFYPVN